jgi:hypothetical protein
MIRKRKRVLIYLPLVVVGGSLLGPWHTSDDWTGQNLHAADFHGRNLRRARLQGADLLAANLGGAFLAGAGLRRANLTDRGNFVNVDHISFPEVDKAVDQMLQ